MAAGGAMIGEEGGQEKRRQRSRREKSLSARWFAMRRVGGYMRRSSSYRIDRAVFYVRLTRLSTLQLEGITS